MLLLQLRTHLGHVFKHQHQQTAINLNNPDSQAMHLETRLVQLDSAINMELWQVGYCMFGTEKLNKLHVHYITYNQYDVL
jgi:hypothetical protein